MFVAVGKEANFFVECAVIIDIPHSCVNLILDKVLKTVFNCLIKFKI